MKTEHCDEVRDSHSGAGLCLRRIGIDTYQEPVIYMRNDCHVCRAEGFEAQTRVQVCLNGKAIVATLNVVTTELLAPGEAGLSESAWRMLGAQDGQIVELSHPSPLESLGLVRAKVYGKRLDESGLASIVSDVAAGRYTDVHIAAFLTSCVGDRLDRDEIRALTRAMIKAGERLSWSDDLVVDKHCVGGLPGNRTTMIVVPILAAAGLTIPKTSSRAITSPAGTADAMETVAPVELGLQEIRAVVEREGGCIAWGGAVRLSPADDVLIRVERALDIDSEGQLVASVLSKKVAAGSTHVLIDLPVGATAKVRSPDAAERLGALLVDVGRSVGLEVRALHTDGTQPVGRGVGPALEAHDVLGVLHGRADAPADLRERALQLAGSLLELSGDARLENGYATARDILEDGRARRKFEAICEAQGGMRKPPRAPYTCSVESQHNGRVCAIDNRRIARVAKLAGAPKAPAAGLSVEARVGAVVERGQPLYTIHAEAPGELRYALDYAHSQAGIVRMEVEG